MIWPCLIKPYASIMLTKIINRPTVDLMSIVGKKRKRFNRPRFKN